MASRAKKTEGTPKDDRAKKNEPGAARIVADLAELLDPRSGHSLTFDNEILTDAQRLALLAKLREEWDSWETDEDVEDDLDEENDFDDEYDLDVEENLDDELDEEDEESFLNY